jgi:preprotein translocase subunit SecB
VGIAAAFQAENASEAELLAFSRVAAPSILFPYVREMVHRLTSDAPRGQVRINPINVAALLNQSDWQIVRAETAVTSSEPSPPSEQSPSASQE